MHGCSNDDFQFSLISRMQNVYAMTLNEYDKSGLTFIHVHSSHDIIFAEDFSPGG